MQLPRRFVVALLFLVAGLFPPESHATDMPPTHAFTFRPVADGMVPEENGSGMKAHVISGRGEAWVESEIGPAVELGEPGDRIDLPLEVFPGMKGAVRITFRPTLEDHRAQHLFRVYGRGDGFSLYMQEGSISFRYYNRETRQRASVSLPAAATPMGEWSTVLVSWDLEGDRKLEISAGKLRRAQKVSEDWPVDFTSDSRMFLGNEHTGAAPFHGAIQSVQFYEAPIWAQSSADTDANTNANTNADMERVPATIARVERKRVLPYTLFFSRTQPKYDLFSNPLLRRWVDRPLFFDRRTAVGETATSIVTAASFLRTQESLYRYGLDGFSVLMAAPQQGQAFLEMVDAIDDANEVKAIPLVMEVSGSAYGDENWQAALERFSEQAERALRSPNVYRIGEKLLVLSYAMDQVEPAEFQRFRKAVEARFGDRFLFIADTTVRRPALLREFHELGGITETTLESFREHLRGWLEVCDGLMWAGGAHTNRSDGTLDRAFYREVLIPVMKQVLAEPRYERKLMGLDAEVGYVNVMTSRRIGKEEQTRRLRDNLQIALEAQPDFVAMPEWDELNENTCISPTLTNSLTTQRILRAYMEQFPGRPKPPELREDTAIPNLIISAQPEIRLGEWLEIELVSLPDGGKTGQLQVELALKNLAGEVVKEFPVTRFDRSKISDHLFRLPSEELAGEPVLIPSLKATTPEGEVSHWEEGLEAIRINATWGLNYKVTKLHLRDLLRPERAEFRVQPVSKGLKVDAMVEVNEPIASVEVVQGSRELAAYDPAGELTPDPGEALIHLHWQAMRNPFGMTGTIRVEGGELKKFVDWTRPEYKRASYRLTPRKDAAGRWEVPFETDGGVNSTNARGGFLIISQPETARIVMKTDRFTADFPVRELLAGGRMASAFRNGVTVEALPLKFLGQVPSPILEKEVAFSTVVEPWHSDLPLQLRVVTTSGKIYRSRPVAIQKPSEGRVSLSVWSQSEGGPVSLEVAESRVPDAVAVFQPERGIVVPTGAGDYFYGLAGGVPFDMAAFAKRHLATAYPAGASTTVPKWVPEGEGHALSFDGKGNFLYFPEETLPRGSFSLEFEIKPTAAQRSYVLCSQRGYRAGGLTLNVVNGEVVGHYVGRGSRMHAFRTGLKLPTDEWVEVSITYDLKQIVVKVNGEEAIVPCPAGPNEVINPFVFGGYGNGKSLGYFAGLLRHLRIRHTGVPASVSQKALEPGVGRLPLFCLESPLISK